MTESVLLLGAMTVKRRNYFRSILVACLAIFWFWQNAVEAQTPQDWETNCMSTCPAGQDTATCRGTCRCTILTFRNDLSIAEREWYVLTPLDDRWRPGLARARATCIRQDEERRRVDEQVAPIEKQIAQGFCKKEDDVVPPIVATTRLEGPKAIDLIDFTVRDVDGSLSTKFGFNGSSGVYVSKLDDWSRSRLGVGDIILRVNNQTISGATAFLTLLGGWAADTKLAICGIRQSDVVGRPATEFRQVIVLKDPNKPAGPSQEQVRSRIDQRRNADLYSYCQLKSGKLLNVDKQFGKGEPAIQKYNEYIKQCVAADLLDTAEHLQLKSEYERTHR
jgi:hypothetical protein